ncbi:hypothetical protein WICMUC_002336 [Wickerhamomyces mucosus]|uniref:V-type proton ATPase subunit C n=1 Tax=Wickerhamomyces mucosus TaxID=1378264 RepID=A0A9P8TEW2_9ASCO|nr:hypothetical protein WICMUC_002336 [Wickerhamomyces mucosus]
MSSDPLAQLILLSIPENTAPETDADTTDPQLWLERYFLNGLSTPSKINIPNFKLGTLDSLVTQSDELNKIDEQLSNSVNKVLEILTTLQDNNLAAVETLKKVDQKPVLDYIQNFTWKSNKYRTDRPLKELIDLISQESFELDSELKQSFTNYNTAKSALVAADRKETGDLSVRSLHDIVNGDDFVQDSEFLTTIVVAVPNNHDKEFIKTYETLTQYVVPESAKLIDQDSEYKLYTVTLFKKIAHSYNTALREHKFIPREFIYSEEAINELRKERNLAKETEQRLKNNLIRLSITAYSDIVSNWFHIKIIRIYVESVLRYGLPPNFLATLIKIPKNKSIDNAKAELIHAFGFLGKRGFEIDNKGKVKKDTSLHEYASLVDTEYEPFVIYTVDIK